MKESKRQFYVSELNRILPMVRSTICKFEEFYQLCDEWEKKRDELGRIKASINYSNKLSETLSKVEISADFIEPELSTLITNLNARMQMLEDTMPDYKQKANSLHEEIKFEEEYYSKILAIVEPGFLKKDDIQDEYIKELAYLMSGKIENGSDEFFDDLVTKTNFYIRLDTEYPQAKEFVLNSENTRAKFYEIFNK